MFAEVIINLPVNQTFHYRIPLTLIDSLKIGHLVEVSFGSRLAQGVIVDFAIKPPQFSGEMKEIRRLIAETPVVSSKQLELAAFISRTCHCDLASAARLFLPPGLLKRGDISYHLSINPDLIHTENENQRLLVNLLSREGQRRGRQIARSFSRRNWQKAAVELAERGLLIRIPVLDPPSVSAKEMNRVELIIQPEKLDGILTNRLDPDSVPLTRQNAIRRRGAILTSLAQVKRSMNVAEIYQNVEGANLADLRFLAEEGLVLLRKEEIWRDPLDDFSFVPDLVPVLYPEQAAAWDLISQQIEADEPRPILLHGVTGSGKTELYLRAVEKVLRSGKGAVVLVPEISLTPQMLQRFGARFPGIIGVVHSSLSDGERYDTWRRILSGEIRLVIGPRSALFSPIKDLGLIIIDECHDDSYKQTPPVLPPYYHTLPVALEGGHLYRALVIMGSATPNVDTFADSSLAGEPNQMRMLRIELPSRIMAHREAIRSLAVKLGRSLPMHIKDDPDDGAFLTADLPPVQIVDMRQELKAGNRSLLSRELETELTAVLERGEQAILFLNRRGAATFVFCRDCGYVFTCPTDQIPLTWHQVGTAEGYLVCHYCNHREDHPKICPECGGNRVKYFGAGTQRIEQELNERFPQARLLRWDSDTTTQKGSHLEYLNAFSRGQADILIGTQMIAKGLDLPLVTLVGIVSADTALNLPDFRSGERTFQILTQVAGRAGRGFLGGRVILQTYSPDNYAIQTASRHDYQAFYQQEMSYRKKLYYPPFSRLVRLIVRGETAEKTEKLAKGLFTELTTIIEHGKHRQTMLIGPAPCFVSRESGYIRWQIIIKGPAPSEILRAASLPPDLQIDSDPVTLL